MEVLFLGQIKYLYQHKANENRKTDSISFLFFLFLKLMNNTVFAKTMKNVRKHRDTKHVTTEARGNYLVSEPNYHKTNFFPKNLLAI